MTYLHSMLGDALLRSNATFPQDRIVAIGASNVFDGAITNETVRTGSTHTCDTHIRVIDGAVQVETVDAKTRQVALAHFQDCRDQAARLTEQVNRQYWHGVVVTVFGGILALSMAPMTAVGTAVSAVGGLIIAGFGLRQTYVSSKSLGDLGDHDQTVQKYMNEWKDPIHEAQEERCRVGERGFRYNFDKQTKGIYVHPLELKVLWMSDASKLLSTAVNVGEAFGDNLMGFEQMAYAFDGDVVPSMKLGLRDISSQQLLGMATRYREARENYYKFESRIQAELNAISNHESEQLDGLQQIKSRWMAPVERAREYGLRDALDMYHLAIAPYKRERDVALAEVKQAYFCELPAVPTIENLAYSDLLNTRWAQASYAINRSYENHPSVIAINQAYERDRRTCEFLYRQSEEAIDRYVISRQHPVKVEAANAREQIASQRLVGNQRFATTLQEILGSDTREQLGRVVIEDVAVVRNWSIADQTREPGWFDVYGSLPRFNASFGDVAEELWNLFWGNEGFGRYASAPSHSWGIHSGQSPFQRQWFSLNRISVGAPVSGLFRQAVNLPPAPNGMRAPVRAKAG